MRLHAAILITAALCFLIAPPASGLDFNYDGFSQENLCGMEPDEKTIELGNISFSRNMTNLSLNIYTPCDISLNHTTWPGHNYTEDTPIALGNVTISPECEEEKNCTVRLSVESAEERSTVMLLLAKMRPILSENNPPNIIDKGPTGNLEKQHVKLRVKTDKQATCKYDLQQSRYEKMRYTFDTNEGFRHVSELHLENGEYTFNAICSDSDDRQSLLKLISFSINSADPKILDYSPRRYSADWDRTVTLRTENAEVCYYAYVQEDNTSNDMQPMRPHGTDKHTFLFDTSYNAADVRCENQYGRHSGTERIMPKEEQQLEATIVMDKDKLLTSGVINVEVMLNKPVNNEPQLTYTLVGSGYERKVPLEGEGKQWDGIMHIDAETEKQVGEFELSRTRETEDTIPIRDGKFFIVDATRPPTMKLVRVEKEDDYIKLSWAAPDEDISHYEIFKKQGEGQVSELDLYTNVSSSPFYDTDVEEGHRYHYRVRPVDEHGNEGFLSNQYSIGLENSSNESSSAEDEPELPELSYADERELKQIRSEFNAYEEKVNDHEKNCNRTLLEEVGDLNTLRDIRGRIGEAVENINETLSRGRAEEDLAQRLRDTLNATKELPLPPQLRVTHRERLPYAKDELDTAPFVKTYLQMKRLRETAENRGMAESRMLSQEQMQEYFDMRFEKVSENAEDGFTRLVLASEMNHTVDMVMNLGSLQPSRIGYSSVTYSDVTVDDETLIKFGIDDKAVFHINAPVQKIEDIALVAFDEQREQKNNFITGSVVQSLAEGAGGNAGKIAIILILLATGGVLGYKLLQEPAGADPAKDGIFKPVPHDIFFTTVDNQKLRACHDLLTYLKNATDDQLAQHMDNEKNDFADWLEQCFGYSALASRIRRCSSREELIREIHYSFNKNA